MNLINLFKPVLNYDVIVIFLITSYILIFKTSKGLKQKNFHTDYKIVRLTGIAYGLIALAALITKNI